MFPLTEQQKEDINPAMGKKKRAEILINIKRLCVGWHDSRESWESQAGGESEIFINCEKVHRSVLFIVLNWELMKKTESRPGELRESSAKSHTCRAPLRLRAEQEDWEKCSVLWPQHYVRDNSCLMLEKKGDQRVSSEAHASRSLSQGQRWKTKWNPFCFPTNSTHTHTL